MKSSKLLAPGHILAIGGALLTGAAIRVYSKGPFMPVSCALAGTGCLPEAPIEVGHIDADYAQVVELFKDNFARGDDVGAGVSAYVDGKLVLDVQGGWQDVDNALPFTKNTLQMVYSSTKVLTAIVVAQLVEQGVLSYDETIHTYWPEFAQGNKENVTLGDLMQHVAGLPFIERAIAAREFEDPEQLSRLLETQQHVFGGERKRCYHPVTGGWYINEVLRRTANHTVDTVAASYMETYGTEWHLKPHEPEYDHRIGRLHQPSGHHQLYNMVSGGMDTLRTLWDVKTDPHQIVATIGKQGITPDGAGPDHITDLRYRRIEGPAYSGYTNAHSIAKLAAMMANGGKAIVQGEPDLLNAETYALATEVKDAEYDLLLRMPIRSTRGGFVMFEQIVIDGVTFTGWCGYSGSMFVWNEEYKIGFGYVTNAMLDFNPPDRRSIRMLEAIVKQAKKSAQSHER